MDGRQDRGGDDACDGGAALLSVFDRIYVLNLPQRTDRRREMEQQLARIGLALAHPGVTLFPAIRPEAAGTFPTIGCRGCFESHLAIFRDALERGFDSILVIEDDTNFRADFNARMPELARGLAAEHWDIFYGWSEAGGVTPAADGLVEIAPETALTTSHFIGYRRRAFAALVPYLEQMAARPLGHPEGGPMHVDGAFGWFRAARPDLRSLGPAQPLARQRPSRTDIQDERWFDRIAALRPLVALYRSLKTRRRGE